MLQKDIWYLPGPFFRYEEDVKALARKHGLRIIDADVTEDRTDAAEHTPKVTLKPEFRPAKVRGEVDPSDKLNVEELKAALAEKGVEIPDGAKKADLAELLRTLSTQ